MPQDTIPQTVAHLRETFTSGRTRPLSWRVQQLEKLKTMLQEKEAEFAEALKADLGKSSFESWTTEINFTVSEIQHTLQHLASWARPEKVIAPLGHQPSSCYIRKEPLGVVLVLGAWNYPLQLTLSPAIAAISAGNCVILKPSEISSNVAAAMSKWLPEYVDKDAIRVIEGGIPETTELLKEKFDHIFFTGNGTVGRIIMRAAAEHLTPVTLELGGKSPCFVDRDVDLKTAARRILWGKFVNAGQTCVAPDYILVDRNREVELIEQFKEVLKEFYGDDPQKSPDYGRIIHKRHHARLVKLMEGEDVAAGGQHDEEDLYIAPTILRNVDLKSPLMDEEIFGPLLPVIPVKNVGEAIHLINQRPHPLALYIFSSNKEHQRQILDATSSGGACINETIMHLGISDLPFGGVGESGMGAYHGKTGFDTFSHRRSVLQKSTRVDPKLRYPPYDDTKVKWVKRLF